MSCFSSLPILALSLWDTSSSFFQRLQVLFTMLQSLLRSSCMVWILSWRSLFSAKVSRWYVVCLLAIRGEESLYWWVCEECFCWLKVGVGVWLASICTSL